MATGTLGIIGFGNMGAAIAGGLVSAEQYRPADIHICDLAAIRREEAMKLGHTVHGSPAEVASAAGTIILAVKPKDIPAAAREAAGSGAIKLAISIAAGVSLETLEEAMPDIPVIRAMPNAACMAGAGATVIARGIHTGDADIEAAKQILGATGYVTELPESLMDAVTGLAGSGPAYVALMIEAMADGGVKMGLSRTDALRLAAETVRGTAFMVLEKGIHPAQLRDMVTSPGGTTIEGIAALERGAFRGTVIAAVEAAARRSKELGRK